MDVKQESGVHHYLSSLNPLFVPVPFSSAKSTCGERCGTGLDEM